MKFTITIKGVVPIVRKLDDAYLLQPVGTAVRMSALEGERLARSNAPKWRNVLAGSMTHTLQGEPIALIAQIGPAKGASSQYAKVMEFGRRPGKQPPVSAIEAWARSKGLEPYVVARSIGRKGIKGRHYMKRTAEALRPYVRARFSAARREIKRRWAA